MRGTDGPPDDRARERPRISSTDEPPGGDAGQGDDEGALVRAVTARAIRRLDMLEYAILAAAAVLAIVAGALVAWLVASVTSWPFRPVWLVASVLLFTVPALVVWGQERADASSSGRSDAH